VIDTASVSTGGSGTIVQENVRSGISATALNGHKPERRHLPERRRSVDGLTTLNAIPAWPFGCRVVVFPDLDTTFGGSPVLIDSAQAGILYQSVLAPSRPVLGLPP